MPNITGIKHRILKLHYGITTPYEFFLAAVNSALRGITGKEFELSEKHEKKRRFREVVHKDYCQIGDIKFPSLEKEYEVL